MLAASSGVIITSHDHIIISSYDRAPVPLRKEPNSENMVPEIYRFSFTHSRISGPSEASGLGGLASGREIFLGVGKNFTVLIFLETKAQPG